MNDISKTYQKNDKNHSQVLKSKKNLIFLRKKIEE